MGFAIEIFASFFSLQYFAVVYHVTFPVLETVIPGVILSPSYALEFCFESLETMYQIVN